jgi:hypothetical protein
MLDPTHSGRRGKKQDHGAGEARKSASEYSKNPKSQRNRARIRAKKDEDLDLERAMGCNRHPKWYARRKTLASDEYNAMDSTAQAKHMDEKLEALIHVRDVKGISGRFFESVCYGWLIICSYGNGISSLVEGKAA